MSTRTIRLFYGLAVACLAATLISPPATAGHGYENPYHWNRNQPTATAVAQVYFEDFSGPNWPVLSAVYAWDKRENYYRAFYKASNTCNNDVVHCVPVRSGNYGQDDPPGFTVWQTNSSGHFQHGTVKMFFNTYYSSSDARKAEIACHEMGHALIVIGHASDTDSCMHVGTPYSDHPTAHDRDYLADRYDH